MAYSGSKYNEGKWKFRKKKINLNFIYFKNKKKFSFTNLTYNFYLFD